MVHFSQNKFKRLLFVDFVKVKEGLIISLSICFSWNRGELYSKVILRAHLQKMLRDYVGSAIRRKQVLPLVATANSEINRKI